MPRHSAKDPSLSDQRERDFATLVPRQWRASEQVPSGATAPEGSESFPELGAAEPSLRAAPGVADFPDQPILLDRPSFARRMLRGVVRFCIVFLIGVAATLTWQSEGDQTVELVRTAAATWGPAWTLDWLPSARAPLPGAASSASSTNPPPVAQAAAKPETALPQSAPAAQMSAAQTPAAAATPPESARQIETMARDLTGVRHSIEQLAARQEDMAQSIATLQAAEQELKQKIASLPRPAPRHKPPPHAPASPGAQSSALPPSAASSAVHRHQSLPHCPRRDRRRPCTDGQARSPRGYALLATR